MDSENTLGSHCRRRRRLLPLDFEESQFSSRLFSTLSGFCDNKKMPRSDEAEWWFNAVYEAVQEIPHGHVTSYGHIARLLGKRMSKKAENDNNKAKTDCSFQHNALGQFLFLFLLDSLHSRRKAKEKTSPNFRALLKPYSILSQASWHLFETSPNFYSW